VQLSEHFISTAQVRTLASRAEERRVEPRLHFGLGACGKVDEITIKWPRGTAQTRRDVPINRYLTIEEPK
jgi:ASPIC and UnbV